MARKPRRGTGTGGAAESSSGESRSRSVSTQTRDRATSIQTIAIAAVGLVIVTVLATAYVLRAKGPIDVPGQPQVVAEETAVEILGNLADSFEAAGESAHLKKSSREAGEALKAANRKAIDDGINSLGKIYRDADIGFESGMNRKEDRWDPARFKQISHEIAEGLRSLQ